MKQKLFDHFVGAASHHACCSKANKAREENEARMAELAKAAGQDGIATCLTELSKSSREIYKSHLEQGEACAAFAELLSTKKVDDGDELNKLMPSEISGIAPPVDGKPLHRAIGRAGAPAIEDKTATLEFSKIFGEG
jgi:hypothetical protein